MYGYTTQNENDFFKGGHMISITDPNFRTHRLSTLTFVRTFGQFTSRSRALRRSRMSMRQ